MVNMILNLMALEEDLKDIHHYMDRLAGKFPGVENDPTIINLCDRLKIMEVRLHEALSQWPQLGSGSLLDGLRPGK